MFIKSNALDSKKYRCKKPVANWLVYKKHLPVFSFEGEYYIFIKTAEFEKAIKELPFYLRILQ